MAAIMSSTIINVAIPDMSRSFALGQDRAQWVSSGFMVAMTVSMLTTPWLLARYGYRRTYGACMALLMAGGVLGGLASDYTLVLLSRVVEGLAAGVVQPIPAIVIMRAFAPQEQGRASAVFGMGVVLAPALGPSLGGVLVDLLGWRSIFFMVVPLCLASLWLSQRYVPVSAPGGAAVNKDVSLDWRGVLLAGGGALCLINGMVELHSHSGAQAYGLLGVAAVALALFVWWQRRIVALGGEPLMSPALFGHRPFAMGSVVAFIYGAGLFGSTYLLPIYMQLALSYSPSFVGAVLLPAGLVLALTIAMAGRFADRYPTYGLVTIGLGLLGASFALTVFITLEASSAWLLALVVLGRIGLGFVLPSLNMGSLRSLPPSLLSQGSSGVNFLRTLGGALGVSLCGIVLEWRLAAHGDSLSQAASSPARLAAFNESFFMLAALCALAMLAAWRMRPEPPSKA